MEAIPAAIQFVNSKANAKTGLVAGELVCISVRFIADSLTVDDMAGAITAHGAAAFGEYPVSNYLPTERATMVDRGMECLALDRTFLRQRLRFGCAVDWNRIFDWLCLHLGSGHLPRSTRLYCD